MKDTVRQLRGGSAGQHRSDVRETWRCHRARHLQLAVLQVCWARSSPGAAAGRPRAAVLGEQALTAGRACPWDQRFTAPWHWCLGNLRRPSDPRPNRSAR